jgi:hypothetical protein
MIKILGLFFISLSVFLLGYMKSQTIKRKTEIEDGFVLLIAHIGETLSSSNLPLCEIYKSFFNKALFYCGFLHELKTDKCDAFYEAVEKRGRELLKNDKLYELVCDFSKRIGTSPSSHDGKRLCENCLLLIKEEIANSRPKDKTRQELYFKLSFVLAVFVFLMFI